MHGDNQNVIDDKHNAGPEQYSENCEFVEDESVDFGVVLGIAFGETLFFTIIILHPNLLEIWRKLLQPV